MDYLMRFPAGDGRIDYASAGLSLSDVDEMQGPLECVDLVSTPPVTAPAEVEDAQYTYTGCLIQPPDPQKCVPDGTRWADLFPEARTRDGSVRALGAGGVRLQYTACWEGEDADGHWVVGANGFDSADPNQGVLRDYATGGYRSPYTFSVRKCRR
jgi:hypothetical protein